MVETIPLIIKKGKECAPIRENRKKKAVLFSALLAAAMVGTSALPVSAAEEDTASQVKPHVTEDVVTWEGGLLE